MQRWLHRKVVRQECSVATQCLTDERAQLQLKAQPKHRTLRHIPQQPRPISDVRGG